MRIDSHQHFWEYNPGKGCMDYGRNENHSTGFMPEDLFPVLQENKIDGCVQCRQIKAKKKQFSCLILLQSMILSKVLLAGLIFRQKTWKKNWSIIVRYIAERDFAI